MKKDRNPLLVADLRDRLGTRYAQRARTSGRLPAVVYGHKADPVAVTLDAKTTIEHITSGSKVFRINIPGESDGQFVLLKDVQFDYLGTNLIHADFARVDLNEKVRTRVHVDLIGEAVGLKTAGAILLHPTPEVEIECRVTEIPDSITVDIGTLDVDQVFTAGQLALPGADMRLVTDSHAIIAQIVVQKEEVAATAEAGAVAPASTQPEVIGEKEREEKKAAAEASKGGDKKGGGGGGKKE